MPDCDYCDRSFPDEGSLLEHMGESHEGQLGRIDRRRVEDHYGGDDDGLSSTVGYAIVGIVIVGVVAGAVYAAVGAFSGGPPEPIHEHGTINMTIDGEPVRFSSAQYTQAEDFHFHGSGPRWHMHPTPPERLTLAEAMQRLGIELSETSITVEGQTYDASASGTSLLVQVNGESVDPTSYKLREGDHIRIVVRTGN